MNAPAEIARVASAEPLPRLLELQRAAFQAERYPDVGTRRDRLRRLSKIATEHEPALIAAIDRDFGHRSAHETRLAELYVVAAETRTAIRRLTQWMKPRRVPTPLHLLPARAHIERQPLGVVGIISPWNYPVQLALVPAVAALAAGNRVMLKPSELTPATSSLLAELVATHFREDEFAVVQGDATIGSQFAALPFDHLFFTGSTTVGRSVAMAAAANLTPVTLELGGKSPAVFDTDADFARTIPRLVVGKLLNAGRRELLAERIRERAVAWAVAAVDAATIDFINIYNASKLAMKTAVERLAPAADFVLIDGFPLDLPLPQRPLIKGDARCHAIAAASILAKMHRDGWMRKWDEVYPEYGLAHHKGYGTPEHLRVLEEYGPTPLHRLSFEPVRACSFFPMDPQLDLFPELEAAACQ
jgi:acyl-CoA reductase-like NAD-dependent aldehyde dehydrogenase